MIYLFFKHFFKALNTHISNTTWING